MIKIIQQKEWAGVVKENWTIRRGKRKIYSDWWDQYSKICPRTLYKEITSRNWRWLYEGIIHETSKASDNSFDARLW